jgi:SAM-dependent methyltransferase
MSHELLANTFDQWARDGRAAGMEDEHGDVARQVIARMGIRPGEQVLDLGCGSGWATRLLAKASSGVTAVGVDVSPTMVATAESNHSLTIRARYEIGRFEALGFGDAKFHRVFSMEALYYAVDLDAALREAFRVARPSGTLDVVVDYYRDSPLTACWATRTGVPMHYLGAADWSAAIERAGFGSVSCERVVDSRGVGEPARFQPSCCYPSWDVWREIRAAGSLWIRAVKPA